MRPSHWSLLGCKGTNFSGNHLIYKARKNTYLMKFNIK